MKKVKCCTVWTLKLMTSRVDFLCLTFHHSTASTTPNSSNCFLSQKDIDHLLPKKNIRSITWPLYLVHILVEVFYRPTVPRRAYICISNERAPGAAQLLLSDCSNVGSCKLRIPQLSPRVTLNDTSRSLVGLFSLPADSLLPLLQQGLQRQVDQSSLSLQGHSCMRSRDQTGELQIIHKKSTGGRIRQGQTWKNASSRLSLQSS